MFADLIIWLIQPPPTWLFILLIGGTTAFLTLCLHVVDKLARLQLDHLNDRLHRMEAALEALPEQVEWTTRLSRNRQ